MRARYARANDLILAKDRNTIMMVLYMSCTPREPIDSLAPKREPIDSHVNNLKMRKPRSFAFYDDITV